MKEFLSPWTWRRWLTAFPECFPTLSLISGSCEKHTASRRNPSLSPPVLRQTGIFLPLYDLPEALRLPYFQLKIQELLLFLGRYVPDQKTVTKYHSEQTELIRQIHDQLTKDLSCRFTIEELSRQYLINTSSLKEVFKAVYGLPIASYMKEYRIREAMRLLRETDESISSIAARVGYETQGKFTKSFRDVAQVLPSEYRKQRRQASR